MEKRKEYISFKGNKKEAANYLKDIELIEKTKVLPISVVVYPTHFAQEAYSFFLKPNP